jgi:GTP-sensing pleiotropic transcriptional regulator CodY
MSVELKIIRDLQAGQSTAASIADRLRIPEAAVLIILNRLTAAGTVCSRPIAGVLTVWHLTTTTSIYPSLNHELQFPSLTHSRPPNGSAR